MRGSETEEMSLKVNWFWINFDKDDAPGLIPAETQKTEGNKVLRQSEGLMKCNCKNKDIAPPTV